MKLWQIIKAWKNVFIKKSNIEQIAMERMKVCNECPNKTKIFDVEVCGLCHCPLIAKTRDEKNSCDERKWNR